MQSNEKKKDHPRILQINAEIETLKKLDISRENISDGFHTYKELYNHRMLLFSVICNLNKEHAWKSKLHDDGQMFADYFIIGITTNEGDFTYHYPLTDWEMFDVQELERAPEWDGHTSEDITRLLSLTRGELVG